MTNTISSVNQVGWKEKHIDRPIDKQLRYGIREADKK